MKVTREPCPKCREEGHDRSGDNLARFPEGNAYCNRCGYKENKFSEELPEIKERRLSKLSPELIEANYPLGVDPARKLDASMSEYQTRVSMSEEDGSIDTVYYPYFKGSRVEAYKVRKLTVPKKEAFYVSGTIPGLFGKNTCKKYGRWLILTEGEEDCMAAKHMTTVGLASSMSPFDVCSLPNGASLDKTTLAEQAFFKEYKNVFLCLDNDDAGMEARIKLADWLSQLTSVYIVKLDPAIGKDASDYLKAGKVTEFRTAITAAVLYEPEGIMNGSDISLESLLEPEAEGYLLPFKGLHDKLHGVRKGEIMTVCAGSGIGKTTVVREIVHSLISQGLSVANVALEDQMKVTAKALIALDMNIPLSRFRFSPPSKEEAQASYDKMVGNGKTFFFKHFGGLNDKNLMSTLYSYAKSKEVDFIVLDHLSMVISASDTQNERKAIDTLMTQLADMVVETGVGLIQIVHLKRTTEGKSYAHGGEVELTDLRGSAALEQLSWAVVGIERDQQGDDNNFSRIRILKNRTFGFTGLSDTLYYNPLTGRIANAEPEPVVITESLPLGVASESKGTA